jgi:proteasome assembly chaperone (PAC2) family protein
MTVRWSARPKLRTPVFVAAFEGWNDAGDAASDAVRWLGRTLGAREFASVDPEEYFDFQAARPQVELVDGVVRRVAWPSIRFLGAGGGRVGRDFVLCVGIEPNLKWPTFCSDVLTVAQESGCETAVTLGALLADTPHSRPVRVTGSAIDDETAARLGIERSRYQGPTGIVGVLHNTCSKAGIPSASLWASVPHYVAAAPNPKVALALVRAFEGIAGVVVDAGELESAAEDYERQVSAAVATDPEVKAFVERLETAADEIGVDTPDEQDIPSADTIARDFQRFLRQRGPNAGD